MDNLPDPTISKKTNPSNMQKSVRASCIVAQNPDLDSMETFVVAMATQISITNGIVANRVSNPTITIVPQTISTTPTNGPKNWGAGIPILANRPAPSAAGNRNFCIPSDRNTQPTRIRTKITAADVSDLVSIRRQHHKPPGVTGPHHFHHVYLWPCSGLRSYSCSASPRPLPPKPPQPTRRANTAPLIGLISPRNSPVSFRFPMLLPTQRISDATPICWSRN